MATIPLEYMAFAREPGGSAGVAIAQPTHLAPLPGELVPKRTTRPGRNQVASLSNTRKRKVVRKWADFAQEGDMDLRLMPFFCQMIMDGSVSAPTASVGGYSGLVGGAGYTTASVTFGAAPAGGTTATGTATVAGGAVTGITITNPGKGYLVAPSLTITGDGAGASATAVLTTAKLWKFTRKVNINNILSATIWWGDPTTQMFRSAYAMLTEMTISSDPSGEDFVGLGYNGRAWWPEKVSGVIMPPDDSGGLIVPGYIQVWLDVLSAIGTTQLIGKVISAEHTIPSGVTYKWPGQGPGSGLNYQKTGRARTEPTTALSMEMYDTAEYDIYEGAQQAKLRVRHNGDLIQQVGATPFYEYVQVDMYGTLDDLDWGELEDSNRLLDLTMLGEESSTAGTDCEITVQVAKSTI